jgi:dTDP-4-dehydrorhamnose reductase
MEHKQVLLTGGSGNLGSSIVDSGKFENLLSPPHSEFDITSPSSMSRYLQNNPIDCVVHCAAKARVQECEKDSYGAFSLNTIGTTNLVRAVQALEQKQDYPIRFIHISTDAVYAGTRGRYKEIDETKPENVYGWSKLAAECAVRELKDCCIIRTSFFDPDKITFPDAATDAYTSKMCIGDLVHAIYTLPEHHAGILNIGSNRVSYFDLYSKYKQDIQPRSISEINASINSPLPLDSSMNCSLWKEIHRKHVS